MGSVFTGSRQTPQNIYWLDLGHMAQTILHGRVDLPVLGQLVAIEDQGQGINETECERRT